MQLKPNAGFLGLLLLLVAQTGLAKQEGELEAGGVNPGHEEKPAWFKASFLDIREDLAEAKDAGRRLMLYFYQDGCPYCKILLQDNFARKDIAETTQKYFDTVAINMWGDREVIDFNGRDTTEKAFARDMKVMFTPTLLMLDEQGQVAARLNGYYSPQRFAAVLEHIGNRREKQRPLAEVLSAVSDQAVSGKLHHSDDYVQPPYRLGDFMRLDKKPFLILFEQARCAYCDELHGDILKRPESQALLQRYHVVLLDMWSDTPVQAPDGRMLSAREWARELGIQYAPTLSFWDGGREVFRTEAYLKAFHLQTSLDYVASGAYKTEAEFQRYVDERADGLRAQGIEVDLMR